MGGVGNIEIDPAFADEEGADGIRGTDDDDLRLTASSVCIDRGNAQALPADRFDADGTATPPRSSLSMPMA